MSGIALVRKTLPDCSHAERKVAAYILAQPQRALFCTVAELARQAKTSAPAVIRLCQRAGLSGYREFQLLLAQDLYAPPEGGLAEAPFRVVEGPALTSLATDLVQETKILLDRILDQLEPEPLESAARALASARAVLALGPAEARFAACSLAQGLQGLGKPCSRSSDPAEQADAARALAAGDLIVAFKAEDLPESVRLAAGQAQRAGARIISVGARAADALSASAEIRLALPATETARADRTALSRTAFLAIADLLVASVVAVLPDRPRPPPARGVTEAPEMRTPTA